MLKSLWSIRLYGPNKISYSTAFTGFSLLVPLIGKTTEELVSIATSLGEAAFRGKQLAEWIYRKGAADIELMTNLPKAFRKSLSEKYTVYSLSLDTTDSAEDGTVKYLLQLHDNEKIETVYLPYSERVSVCVSSQVGCAAGCTFCATAIGGLARNMTAGEIVEEILLCAHLHPERRISHTVFMGMGEPLMNYDEVIKSARIMSNEIGMSPRHITISTVGVAPGILAMSTESMPLTLALSLHAPNDELREQLIPTAKKWKLAEILDACKTYYMRTKRNLTFEYLLIADVNDSYDNACELADLINGLPGNVNLIPFNYVDTKQGFKRPTSERIKFFRQALEDRGRVTTQRMERGHAINAACGQLRRLDGTLRPRKNVIPVSAA